MTSPPSGLPSHRPGGRLLARLLVPWFLAPALLATVHAPAASQTTVAEFTYEFYPRSSIRSALDDGPATGASVQVVRGSMVLPPLYRSTGTLLALQLSAGWVGAAVHPLDPSRDEPLEALYDLDLNLVMLQSLSEKWDLALVASPGIASDLRRVDGRHLTFQGVALATRTLHSYLSWGMGVSATNAFGEFAVVPVAAFTRVGDRTRVELLLPAQAAIFRSLPEGIEAGFTANLSGNAYALGRRGELRDAVVRYSVVNAGPAVHIPLGSSLRLSLTAGASLARRLEIDGKEGNRIQDARLRRGYTLQAGVAWLLPEVGAEG